MNPRSCLISALAGISLTTATIAAGQTPFNQAKASQVAEDNQIICKTQTGMNTRFPEKTCRTRLQWEQLRIEHQRAARELIDRPMIETRR